MNNCHHTHTTETCTVGYSGPVSRYNENRAAHGNICVTVRCNSCGAKRLENHNGHHEEIGDWGPTAAERAAAEEQQREKAQNQQRAEILRRGRGIVRGPDAFCRRWGARRASAQRSDGTYVWIEDVDTERVVVDQRALSWHVLRAAARQADRDLSEIYSAILADAEVILAVRQATEHEEPARDR